MLLSRSAKERIPCLATCRELLFTHAVLLSRSARQLISYLMSWVGTLLKHALHLSFGMLNNSSLDGSVCPAVECWLRTLMQAEAQDDEQLVTGQQQDKANGVMTVVIAIKQTCSGHVSRQNQD